MHTNFMKQRIGKEDININNTNNSSMLYKNKMIYKTKQNIRAKNNHKKKVKSWQKTSSAA